MRAFNSLTFSLLVLGAILVAGLIWMAGDIFALFVVGFFLAYLLDPMAEWLVRRGLSRTLAALLITGTLVLVTVTIIAYFGPLAYAQLQEMARVLQDVLSHMMARIRHEMQPYFPALSQVGLGGLAAPAADPPPQTIAGPAATLLATIGLTALTPVVTFYLLKDWPTMTAALLNEIPVRNRPIVKRLGRQIDAVLSGFLRGQAWVCLCTGLIFTAGFLFIGLHYAIAIGMISGALKFLPYIGPVIAFTIAMGTSVGQAGWDGGLFAGIVITFLVAEFADACFLSPRIIGNRVRLAPALVIFAVLVGGKLLGVLGVFLAIPLFAVGRVLLSFWLHRQRMQQPAKRKRATLVLPDGRPAQEIRLVREGKA